ncbi:hypothetical protein COB55_03360 [Candidatus Wolfebacteria bacterium]|nr:MAG: hypothetical protein COB55_03360 [Candidatus Wolfebacteria bacterium]
MKKTKRTQLPKSVLALADHIKGLTRTIMRLHAHFQTPANSHDASQRRLFAIRVARRSAALGALKPLDESLHDSLVTEIKKGGKFES